MVAFCLFEPALRREALAVAKKRTVTIDLEIVCELAQAKHLPPISIIVDRSIAKRGSLWQQIPELTLELFLLLLL